MISLSRSGDSRVPAKMMAQNGYHQGGSEGHIEVRRTQAFVVLVDSDEGPQRQIEDEASSEGLVELGDGDVYGPLRGHGPPFMGAVAMNSSSPTLHFYTSK